MKSKVLFLAMLVVAFQESYAAKVFEHYGNLEEANNEVLSLLNGLSPGSPVSQKETKGFRYHYKDSFWSITDYSIYLGQFSSNKDLILVRVESSRAGEEEVYNNLLQERLYALSDQGKDSKGKSGKEDGVKKRPLTPKSHFVSQSLNLLSPAASVFYNAYDSPLYTSYDTFLRMATYFLVDLALIGGAYAYVESNIPHRSLLDKILMKPGASHNAFSSKNSGALVGAILLSRLYRIPGAFRDTQLHNKLVEMSYTVSF